MTAEFLSALVSHGLLAEKDKGDREEMEVAILILLDALANNEIEFISDEEG